MWWHAGTEEVFLWVTMVHLAGMYRTDIVSEIATVRFSGSVRYVVVSGRIYTAATGGVVAGRLQGADMRRVSP